MDVSRKMEDNPGGCRSYVTKMSLIVFFLVYVLLGAYVFLLIETSTVAMTQQQQTDSGGGGQHQHTPPIEEIRTAIDPRHQEPPVSDEMMQLRELVTRQVLDRLWDITENLNILYKENWTRLAADEITKLHSSLHQLMKKDCVKRKSHEQQVGTTAPSTTSAPVQQVTYIKWSYSAAFLYALSVITTLGSCPLIPETNEAKVLTIIYAAFGIPLFLVYLTVVGSAASSFVRCWPARHSGTASRRRDAPEPPVHFANKLSVTVNSYQPNETYHHSLKPSTPPVKDETVDSLESSTSSGSQRRRHRGGHGGLAGALRSCWPILVCLWLIVAYVAIGAWLFSWLLSWPATDALLLSFMLFTTMGVPDADGQSVWSRTGSTVAVSLYLLAGLTLCSFCFHLVYEWLVWRWSPLDSYRSDPALSALGASSSRRSSRS